MTLEFEQLQLQIADDEGFVDRRSLNKSLEPNQQSERELHHQISTSEWEGFGSQSMIEMKRREDSFVFRQLSKGEQEPSAWDDEHAITLQPSVSQDLK